MYSSLAQYIAQRGKGPIKWCALLGSGVFLGANNHRIVEGVYTGIERVVIEEPLPVEQSSEVYNASQLHAFLDAHWYGQ